VRLQFAAVGLDEFAEGLAIAGPGPGPGEDCPDHRAVILPADRMRAWEQAPSRLDWIQQAPALLATAAAAAIRLLLATVRLLLGAS